jgi:hypothetical protein
MRRIQLLLLAMICTLAAQAQIADGYYRVKSSKQGRYVRVLDNRGSINLQTTDADMGALCTQRSWDIVVSDPGSVIYIKKMTEGYDLQSQGTGSYSIISYEVRAKDMGDGKYWCYASKSGMTKYLADEKITFLSTDEEIERGCLVTNITPAEGEYLDWDLMPIAAEGNYFGLQPTVSAGGSYYQTFYAAFPFTFLSEGMEAYYVDNINEATGKVNIKEITGGVPVSTPVIVKCSAQNAASNKLNVGASTSGSASGNKLTGVYFCYPDGGQKHTNVTAYDPSTMRVLGTASDGSLAFVKATNLKYIPSNTAYIKVSPSAPDVLKVITGEEPSYPRGDLNHDSKVNVTDYVVIGNMILGITPETSEADLNNDGTVNVTDAVILGNIILKAE